MRKALLPIVAFGFLAACQSDRIPPVAVSSYEPDLGDRALAATLAVAPSEETADQVFYNKETGKYYRLPAGTKAVARDGSLKPVKFHKKSDALAPKADPNAGTWLSYRHERGYVTYDADISDQVAIARAVKTCRAEELHTATSKVQVLPDQRKRVDFICQ